MLDFANFSGLSLKDVYKLLGLEVPAEWIGNKSELVIEGFASLKLAKKGQLSFWVQGHSVLELKETQASYVLVPNEFSIIDELNKQKSLLEPKSKMTYIKVVDPYSAMIDLLTKVKEKQLENFPHRPQIHPSAKIHSSAVVEGSIAQNVTVGPNCFVSAGSCIEENSVLESGVNVYENVKVGKGCILQSGSVIGSRGFGFRQSSEPSKSSKRLLAVPHFGGVVLSDEVQIGANSVVASGFLEPTILGKRSCIDSLVQIGHNVTLGSDCYMASQSGIAGSTVVGKGVRVAGGAQIAGHLKIGDGVTITAKAGVTRSVEAGVMVSGYPAMEHGLWKRLVVKFRKG